MPQKKQDKSVVVLYAAAVLLLCLVLALLWWRRNNRLASRPQVVRESAPKRENYGNAEPSASSISGHLSEAGCYRVKPTGCDKAMHETTTPKKLFRDPAGDGPHSGAIVPVSKPVSKVENYTMQTSMGTVAHLRYDGPDERLQGVFTRIRGMNFTRVARQSRGLPAPNGRWAHEVWLNVNTNIAIYDHEMWAYQQVDIMHLWSVGPWSERGGVAYEQRYAYLYAWFGTDEGEGKDKPSEWWLQRASICNGWVGQAHGYAENGGCAGNT